MCDCRFAAEVRSRATDLDPSVRSEVVKAVCDMCCSRVDIGSDGAVCEVSGLTLVPDELVYDVIYRVMDRKVGGMRGCECMPGSVCT